MLLALTACGYRLGQGPYVERGTKLSIPYIQGDKNGDFTNALIYAVEAKSSYRFCGGSGDRVLRVAIQEIKKEHVGWRYDIDSHEELTDVTIPQETRLVMVVIVELLDGQTYALVGGPFEIRESVEFDHDYYYSADEINVVSLGQLTDYDTAFDVSLKPLYAKISEKIVDAINF